MSLDAPSIEKMITVYEKETKALKDELLRICWFMRGSISYNDSYMLSNEDRTIIGKIIEGNLETTKESGLPFF